MKRQKKKPGNTPNRGMGRIDDVTWRHIQDGFTASGAKTRTRWYVKVLLKECKRLGVK